MGFGKAPASAGSAIQSPDYLNEFVAAYNERRLVVADPPAALTPLAVGDNMQSLTLWRNLWRHGWATQWWPREEWARLEDFDGKPNGYDWSIGFGYDVHPFLVRHAGQAIQSASVQNLYYDMYLATTRTFTDAITGISEQRFGWAVVGATKDGNGNTLPDPLPEGYFRDTPQGWADAKQYAEDGFNSEVTAGTSTAASTHAGITQRIIRYPPMYFPEVDGWGLTLSATRCRLVVSGVATSTPCFIYWYGKDSLSPHTWHLLSRERVATQAAVVTQSEWNGTLDMQPWPGAFPGSNQILTPTFEPRALLIWQFAYRGPVVQSGFAQAGFSQG